MSKASPNPLKRLTDAERWKILAESDLTQAASALGEEAPEKAGGIVEQLGAAYMVDVVSQLGSDVASDLLRNLPEEFRQQILSTLPEAKSGNLREILSYPEGTAGSLMSKEYFAIPEHLTVHEATNFLRSISGDKKSKIGYLYVVDRENRLVGVLQLRHLIFHTADKSVRDIMSSPVVQVETGMTQIDVAKLLRRHRYLGLPVVDVSQRLVGVISADNVLQVLEEEAADDIAKIVGTGVEEIRSKSVLRILRLRLPWLMVSLASGLLCAFISGFFQNNVQTMVPLFLFVPVVLGLSESTGVQGATIVVRNIALGHVSWKDLGSLFLREMMVGAWIGFVCGAIVGSIASFCQADQAIGLALAISMMMAITVSGLIGLLLPLLFRHFKMDPAIASGPLVLAICDLQTLMVYFSISGKILAGY
ncbi:MAG: magnesium transporter [Candidatus Omnitrophica bacterium]|nr:magnesium transporter [Candidatus Omnitrophota bacterium]